ncbi:SCO family protein [Burkholderia sp. Bp9142]|uniref:SCO family protein n=2 Tax=unclassified Burkholderia TaxID=2613784 RepID=UPI000F572C17|nr:SCO family protein [Burkholderia sp. Bp9142]RQR37318.1 SCO family protein [Burkholderia sp. Bp9142]RQR53869.1 SCO family protein [Burkholderia sp. Bp9140]
MESPARCQPPSLRAAAFGCLVLCVAFVVLLSWLTRGMQVWTLDARRGAMAATEQLMAPAVSLRDARGNPFIPWGVASTSGVVYLVDFIYTRCNSVCNALGPEFLQLQRAIEAQGLDRRVRLLSISIDAGRDDSPSLAAYEARQRADGRIWRVTAPLTTTGQSALLRALNVIAIPDGMGGFVHNGEIHVIDQRGVVLGLCNYAEFGQALQVAQRAAQKAGR